MTQQIATVEPVKKQTLSQFLDSMGMDAATWRALQASVYPGAREPSIRLAIMYCRARKLDIMKKPCHIVPMKVKDAETNTESWRDVIMPGISEVRTTAQRTKQYRGHSKPVYGPEANIFGATAPEWCELTVYRAAEGAPREHWAEYPVRVYFREVVSTKDSWVDGKKVGTVANARWQRAPIQMLTKCAEAAALREAFPEELGGEHTAEEMDGKVIDGGAAEIIDEPEKETGGASGVMDKLGIKPVEVSMPEPAAVDDDFVKDMEAAESVQATPAE